MAESTFNAEQQRTAAAETMRVWRADDPQHRADPPDVWIERYQQEIERLREAAALAYQALLWRGPNGFDDREVQAKVAIDALRDLGLEPLYFRRLEEPQK